jgi:Tfp pilus assembly protein FimV
MTAVPIMSLEPAPWAAPPAAARAAIRRAATTRQRSQRAAARRRGRLAGVAVVLGLGIAAAHAGTALGGTSLATPERGPRVITHVVAPGETLWQIAGELAPGANRRAVVDALVEARGGATLVPGETITWMR